MKLSKRRQAMVRSYPPISPKYPGQDHATHPAQATGEAGERDIKAFSASVMVHGSCPQRIRKMGEWLLVVTQENLTHSLINVVLAYQLSRKIL